MSVGVGHNPGVAVDAAGTAYIAWVGPESNVTTLRFCRLPRNAAACDVTTTIATEGTSLSRPFVSVSGATVRVLSYRYGLPGGVDADVLHTSTNGGVSFDAGTRVGDTPFVDAVEGPGAGVSLTTHAYQNGTVYQRVPIDGTAAPTTQAVLSVERPYNGSVGLVDGATPLVVFSDGAGAAQYRRYVGTGDINDAANWTPAQDIGYADRMHLAGGPNGLFLLAQGADTALHVRRYADGAFGLPVTLPNGTGEAAQSHIFQDAAGRLHVVWPRNDGNGLHLSYATSDNGSTWQQGILAVEPGIHQARAALAPDHVGVVAWHTLAAGDGSEIHVTALGPVPPVPPPPPPPPPPPVQTTPPAPTATPTPAPQRTTVRVPGASITFLTPGSCVVRGGTYRLRLSWKRQRRKGNLFIKIRRTDFYIGTRRVRKDLRAPFVHTFRVRVTSPPGSKITVRARAFIKVHGRRSPTKSIRSSLRVCP